MDVSVEPDAAGGVSEIRDNIVGQYPIGECFCGQSFYDNNVVSSGGSEVGIWRIDTLPAAGLTLVQTAQIDTGGGGGFFTAVSSDGDKNVIIWAVSRRHSKDGGPEPTLYAFAPVPGNPQLQQIFKAPAGNWDVPHPPGDGANSNIVPVVANGHVYVASYKRLDIFGFVRPVVEIATSSDSEPKLAPRFGVITTVEGSSFVMKMETGEEVHVDAEAAVKNGLAPALTSNEGVSVYGTTDEHGVLHAEVIRPAHNPRRY